MKQVHERKNTDSFCVSGMVAEHLGTIVGHYDVMGKTVVAVTHSKEDEKFGQYLIRIMYRDEEGKGILEDVQVEVVGGSIGIIETVAKMVFDAKPKEQVAEQAH